MTKVSHKLLMINNNIDNQWKTFIVIKMNVFKTSSGMSFKDNHLQYRILFGCLHGACSSSFRGWIPKYVYSLCTCYWEKMVTKIYKPIKYQLTQLMFWTGTTCFWKIRLKHFRYFHFALGCKISWKMLSKTQINPEKSFSQQFLAVPTISEKLWIQKSVKINKPY